MRVLGDLVVLTAGKEIELVRNSILLTSVGNLAHVLQEGRTWRWEHDWLEFGVIVRQHVGQQGFLVNHRHFEEVVLDLLVRDARDALDLVRPVGHVKSHQLLWSRGVFSHFLRLLVALGHVEGKDDVDGGNFTRLHLKVVLLLRQVSAELGCNSVVVVLLGDTQELSESF